VTADNGWRARLGWLNQALAEQARRLRREADAMLARHGAKPDFFGMPTSPSDMADVAKIYFDTLGAAAAQIEARLAEVRATVELADQRGEP
jgi:hypothetical protein